MDAALLTAAALGGLLALALRWALHRVWARVASAVSRAGRWGGPPEPDLWAGYEPVTYRRAPSATRIVLDTNRSEAEYRDVPAATIIPLEARRDR